MSEISNTSPNARIDDVLTALSPMKKSKTCSYFDGELTDEKATMRVFGFDSGVRRRRNAHNAQAAGGTGCIPEGDGGSESLT